MKDNKMHMYFVRVASPKIIMPSSDFRVQTLTEVKGGLVVVVDVSDFFCEDLRSTLGSGRFTWNY